MNFNDNQNSTLITGFKSTNNSNTVNGTLTAAWASASASTAAKPLKLKSIRDCLSTLKSYKCNPQLIKSMLVDLLHQTIDLLELSKLEKLINNNIIKSNINNNTVIQSKLIQFNEFTHKQGELYISKNNHFSLLDKNSVSLILQYLSFDKICKIKSTNKLIYSASNSPILLNQLMIDYNPLFWKPKFNINSINNMNLISHLKFNLTVDNLSTINNLSKLTQLKSIQLYHSSIHSDHNFIIDKLELNFINQLLLLQHISIYIQILDNSNSILFDDIAILLSNINVNRTNINGKLLSIELKYCQIGSTNHNSLLSDKGLISICMNCPELKCLKLKGTIITDSGLAYLKQLNSLERLSINSSGSITDNGLLVLLELGNSLTELELIGNHKLTNSYLSIIAQLPVLKLFKFDLKQYSFYINLNESSRAEGLILLSKSKSIETLIIDSKDWYSSELASNLIELSTLRNLSIIADSPITDNGIDSLSKLIQLKGLELTIQSYSDSDSYLDYQLLNKLSKLINLRSLVVNINYYNSNIQNKFQSNPELISMILLIHRIPSLLYFSIPDREYNQQWRELLYKQPPKLYYDTNHYNNSLLPKSSKWFNSVL